MASTIHFGLRPRPDQVLAGLLGSAYLGAAGALFFLPLVSSRSSFSENPLDCARAFNSANASDFLRFSKSKIATATCSCRSFNSFRESFSRSNLLSFLLVNLRNKIFTYFVYTYILLWWRLNKYSLLHVKVFFWHFKM